MPQLCNVVTSIWNRREDDHERQRFERDKHSMFMDAAQRCYQIGRHDSAPTGLSEHWLEPTLAFKAKQKESIRKQKEQELSRRQRRKSKTVKDRQVSARLVQPGVSTTNDNANEVIHQATTSESSINLLVRIISQPPLERNSEDLTQAFKTLRGMEVFEKYPDYVLKQMCSVMSIITLSGEQLLFRQMVTTTLKSSQLYELKIISIG